MCRAYPVLWQRGALLATQQQSPFAVGANVDAALLLGLLEHVPVRKQIPLLLARSVTQLVTVSLGPVRRLTVLLPRSDLQNMWTGNASAMLLAFVLLLMPKRWSGTRDVGTEMAIPLLAWVLLECLMWTTTLPRLFAGHSMPLVALRNAQALIPLEAEILGLEKICPVKMTSLKSLIPTQLFSRLANAMQLDAPLVFLMILAGRLVVSMTLRETLSKILPRLLVPAVAPQKLELAVCVLSLLHLAVVGQPSDMVRRNPPLLAVF